ncbi:hypothetical protein AALP_AAs71129U000100 [Arabis alpina]|uniref:Uncharacterized protein n=1 Tax=Arabis alpina TaxID=50452 RepID=A0A087FWP5_ARAAL|nr:hypothetical protein AALP_AAs71129U000100 [Arabis alpina]
MSPTSDYHHLASFAYLKSRGSGYSIFMENAKYGLQ